MENLQKWLFQDDRTELRTVCSEVTLPLSKEDNAVMRKLIKYVKWSQDPKLHQGMCDRPAVGIAANQIGITKKMYYIRFKDAFTDQQVEHAIINGKIIERSPEISFLSTGEGCLSVLGRSFFHGISQRNAWVVITGYDYFQKKIITKKVTNFEAIVVQHEQDHLVGKLFYDRIDHNDPKKINPDWHDVLKPLNYKNFPKKEV